MNPIAVTCGDPAGIGPEICAKAWCHLRDRIPMVYVGDADHLPGDIPHFQWQPGHSLRTDRLAVYPIAFQGALRRGTPCLNMAQGTIDAIAAAVTLVQQRAAQAVTTAPIHKKTLQEGAGFEFPGHTEFLAHLASADDVVMMLACPELRVVPTTIHIPLSNVPQTLTASLLRRTINITHRALQQDFGIASPRLRVAGLDPHAGEGGNIGTIDRDMIAPVVAERARYMDITGPVSADTLFHAGARAAYDAAICMYHDQALIPIKTIDFDHGVNVTLGLPFVRTSPDHGTAHDIAGQDRASPTSMIAAIELAADMGARRGD
ncbi:MAG: 4-hydroxythreonine-4-phosphate dehydrogenase PdxA [Pseudomonadota bacterium]